MVPNSLAPTLGGKFHWRYPIIGILLLGIAGCSAPISQGGATTSTKRPATTSTALGNPSSSGGAISGGPVSPKQICRGSFSSEVLLDWAPGTVSDFRSYQYGPTPTVPLAHAFPGMPGNARGAWCGTKAGPDATHWWAVVVSHKSATVIIVHGPGEGVIHGLLSVPPRVP